MMLDMLMGMQLRWWRHWLVCYAHLKTTTWKNQQRKKVSKSVAIDLISTIFDLQHMHSKKK